VARLLVLSLVVATIAGAAWIENTIPAPAGAITGLGWEDGDLWAVDANLDTIYRLDPEDGTVLDSYGITVPSGQHPTGIAVENGYVYIGTWNSSTTGYVLKYSPDGDYLGSVNMCGG